VETIHKKKRDIVKNIAASISSLIVIVHECLLNFFYIKTKVGYLSPYDARESIFTHATTLIFTDTCQTPWNSHIWLMYSINYMCKFFCVITLYNLLVRKFVYKKKISSFYSFALAYPPKKTNKTLPIMHINFYQNLINLFFSSCPSLPSLPSLPPLPILPLPSLQPIRILDLFNWLCDNNVT